MRSKAVILAATGASLLLLFTAPAATPTPPPGPDARTPVKAESLEQDFRADAVSGCVGSPLLKKVIILTRSGEDRCKVRHVLPNMGCVVEGGVIRWKILNNCRRLESAGTDPALKITNLVRILPNGTTEPASWSFVGCKPQFDTLETDPPPHANFLFCEVPAESQGVYKYDLVGPDVDTLDPWIEVKRGG